MQAPGLLKQRSYFLLRRLLAFLDPFVETAGFAFLFAFLVPFVETYALGTYPADGPSRVADDPERISLELFPGGLLAELPLLKPSLPLARNFKLQVVIPFYSVRIPLFRSGTSNLDPAAIPASTITHLDPNQEEPCSDTVSNQIQRMTTYTPEI